MKATEIPKIQFMKNHSFTFENCSIFWCTVHFCMLSEDIFISITIFYIVGFIIFSPVLILGTLHGYLLLAALFHATKVLPSFCESRKPEYVYLFIKRKHKTVTATKKYSIGKVSCNSNWYSIRIDSSLFNDLKYFLPTLQYYSNYRFE